MKLSINRFKGRLLIGVFLLGILWMPTTVFAKNPQSTTPDEPVTISILPKLPTDNIGGQYLGYFNLPKQTTQQRTEKINIFNPTAKAIQVKLNVVDAETGENGVIRYTKARSTASDLLVQPGSRLITVPSKLTIASNASVDVPITIQRPRQFSGTKAAAIQIRALADASTSADSIQNEYLYTVGLLLNGTPLTKKQRNPLKLDRITLQKMAGETTAFELHFTNPVPSYLKQMKLNVTFVNQKLRFFTYQQKRTEMKVAPSSRFGTTLELKGKKLVAGYYRVTVDNHNDIGHQTQTYYVKIDRERVRFIPKNTYQTMQRRYRISLGSVLVTAGMVFGAVAVFIKRKKAK